MEKPLGVAFVESHLRHNGIPASRLAHDGDILGIPTESADVLLDPLQRKTLVKKSGIGRRKIRVSHEAESSKAVRDVDGNKILTLANPVAEVIVRSCAVLKASSLLEIIFLSVVPSLNLSFGGTYVNVEHHRQRSVRRSIGWLPNPKLQAVFLAWTRPCSNDVAVDDAVLVTRELHASQRIGRRIDDIAILRGEVFWRQEPQIANRWPTIRNALPRCYTVGCQSMRPCRLWVALVGSEYVSLFWKMPL